MLFGNGGGLNRRAMELHSLLRFMSVLRLLLVSSATTLMFFGFGSKWGPHPLLKNFLYAFKLQCNSSTAICKAPHTWFNWGALIGVYDSLVLWIARL